MKVKHKLLRALKAPDPKKTYGACIESIELQGGALVFGWAIFARKVRKAKAKPKKPAAAK